jgi:hypothetical protein
MGCDGQAVKRLDQLFLVEAGTVINYVKVYLNSSEFTVYEIIDGVTDFNTMSSHVLLEI